MDGCGATVIENITRTSSGRALAKAAAAAATTTTAAATNQQTRRRSAAPPAATNNATLIGIFFKHFVEASDAATV